MGARGVYEITGELEQLTLGVDLSQSLSVSGSLNVRFEKQSFFFRRKLLGYLSASDPPPAWTGFYIGRRDAFVVPVVSSSDDFTSRWNVFVSSSS